MKHTLKITYPELEVFILKGLKEKGIKLAEGEGGLSEAPTVSFSTTKNVPTVSAFKLIEPSKGVPVITIQYND